MTAVQAALGDRDNPTPTTPDTIPTGCHWWTDPDGALCLMPGCMARVQDPDAECTCDKLGARLERVQQQLRDLREQQHYADTWWHALRAAVDAHPDAATLIADTRRKAGR
ncbi:hypothetical protein [Streptomyces sp. MP131-18]|uniref:hypothetical protein n=1 Tax=Streptomyces sp. MP131-18 TaxID=1857892 RepID=UPI00097CA44F|nr:hypothetical protein [Streptomyces sp. MP131-18]ONK09488.1 hypothetical protein STBA_01880 [Streptomyces sp. MP131-18]